MGVGLKYNDGVRGRFDREKGRRQRNDGSGGREGNAVKGHEPIKQSQSPEAGKNNKNDSYLEFPKGERFF